MNRDLINNNNEIYLPYIKTLYKGVELESLSLASKNILYRGTSLDNEEIKYIKECINKKINFLPAAIVFSKMFLSFSKKKETALYLNDLVHFL